MKTKVCGKCLRRRPLSEFRQQGKAYDCRKCHNAETMAWRHADPERTKRIEAARYKRHKAKKAAYQKRQNQLHPEMYRAHSKVMTALRLGRLHRPAECEVCRKATKVVAHHHDYAKPLDVQWVCRTCHALEHNKLKEI